MKRLAFLNNPFTIALTGGIGSGKSFAGEILSELGAIVVDSDQLSHQSLERGESGFDQVVSHFGDSILTNGEIDRKKLAQIVFENPNEKKVLESIIHPLVREKWDEVVKLAPNGTVLVNLIPLLVETNGKARFDLTITISASEEIRKERLLKRGLYISQIEARIKNQVSDTDRATYCDIEILNNGTQAEFAQEITKIWQAQILPRVAEKI